MIRAVWNGTVLAEAPRTVRVEGNHYFPPESLHREHLIESPTTSICPWKPARGLAQGIVRGACRDCRHLRLLPWACRTIAS